MFEEQNVCFKCNKNFSNKFSLNRHQKNSRSCGTESYNCIHCVQKFSTKQRLDHHLNKCEKKINIETRKDKEIIEELREKMLEQEKHYENLLVSEAISKEKIRFEFNIFKTQSAKQVEKLEKTIESLHDKLEKMAATKSVSSVTNINSNNNNITLNMFITPEFVRSQAAKHLTYSHFANGIKGIANFVHDFVLVDKNGKLVYACYDKARHILRYKDIEGTEIEDIDAEQLILIVGQPIREKYYQICKDLREDIERYQRIIEDDDECYEIKKEAKENKARAETSLRVMEIQNEEVQTIGMSKNKKLSRAIEKLCLIQK